jgi:hypothetical protein
VARTSLPARLNIVCKCNTKETSRLSKVCWNHESVWWQHGKQSMKFIKKTTKYWTILQFFNTIFQILFIVFFIPQNPTLTKHSKTNIVCDFFYIPLTSIWSYHSLDLLWWVRQNIQLDMIQFLWSISIHSQLAFIPLLPRNNLRFADGPFRSRVPTFLLSFPVCLLYAKNYSYIILYFLLVHFLARYKYYLDCNSKIYLKMLK